MQKLLCGWDSEHREHTPRAQVCGPSRWGAGRAAGLNGRGLPPFICKIVLPPPAQLRSEQENEKHQWQPDKD